MQGKAGAGEGTRRQAGGRTRSKGARTPRDGHGLGDGSSVPCTEKSPQLARGVQRNCERRDVRWGLRGGGCGIPPAQRAGRADPTPQVRADSRCSQPGREASCAVAQHGDGSAQPGTNAR